MNNPLSSSEQIAHSTVRIEVILHTGEKATGTGFIYKFAQNGDQHIPAIVTNKHVIQNAQSGSFHISLADGQGLPNYGQKEIFSFNNLKISG